MPPIVELTALDLLPLVAKLSPKERAQLVRLVALPSAPATDADRYAAHPPTHVEFGDEAEPDLLAWDAEGWEEFYAAR